MLKSLNLTLPNTDKSLSVSAELRGDVQSGVMNSFEISLSATLHRELIATIGLIGSRNNSKHNKSEISFFQEANIDIHSLGAQGENLELLKNLEETINKRHFFSGILKDPAPTQQCFSGVIAMLLNMPEIKKEQIEVFRVMKYLAVLLEVGLCYRDVFEDHYENLEDDFVCFIEPIERVYKRGIPLI